MIIQRILLTEIPEVKFIRDTRSHNSGNIYVENLHRGRTKKNNFSKTETHFHKKKKIHQNHQDILDYKNMKVGVKLNFGRLATMFQICGMDADILS